MGSGRSSCCYPGCSKYVITYLRAVSSLFHNENSEPEAWKPAGWLSKAPVTGGAFAPPVHMVSNRRRNRTGQLPSVDLESALHSPVLRDCVLGGGGAKTMRQHGAQDWPKARLASLRTCRRQEKGGPPSPTHGIFTLCILNRPAFPPCVVRPFMLSVLFYTNTCVYAI